MPYEASYKYVNVFLFPDLQVGARLRHTHARITHSPTTKSFHTQYFGAAAWDARMMLMLFFF